MQEAIIVIEALARRNQCEAYALIDEQQLARSARRSIEVSLRTLEGRPPDDFRSDEHLRTLR